MPEGVDGSGSGVFDGTREVLECLVAADGVDGSGSGGTKDKLGCLASG